MKKIGAIPWDYTTKGSEKESLFYFGLGVLATRAFKSTVNVFVVVDISPERDRYRDPDPGGGVDDRWREGSDRWIVDGELLIKGKLAWHHERAFPFAQKEEALAYAKRIMNYMDARTPEELEAEPGHGPLAMRKFRGNPESDAESMSMGEVYPNLFVGSAPIYCLPGNFDVIIFMAEEFQPEFPDPPEQLLIYAPIRDADPTAAERTRAMNVACAIVKHLKEGKQVLVTCISGWNRSAFAAGLAMRMMGVPTRKIVSKMRSARGEDALGNPYFLAILEAV